jgi:pimeloyl-ACP methyl ester carboxylesterase
MEDNFFHFNYKRIRYLQGGPAEGTPLILLHGIGAASDIWEPLFTDCSQTYNTIALDFPGFGKSDQVEPLNVPSVYIDVVDHLTQVLHIEQAIMIGHSMGGIVAAEFANKYPKKVSKLVLIDSGGFEKIFPLFKSVSSRLSEKMLLPLLGNRWIGSLGFRFFYGSKIRNQTYNVLSGYWSDSDIIHNFTRVVKELGDWNVFDDLTRITCPTMIIWGQLDWIVPAKHAKAAQNLLPHAVTRIIKNAGHCPHAQKPDVVNPILLDFLAGN